MKLKSSILTSMATSAIFATSLMAETELTVYTAVEAEDLSRYAAKFNESHPDITINWVRDSTGIITAKLLLASGWILRFWSRSACARFSVSLVVLPFAALANRRVLSLRLWRSQRRSRLLSFLISLGDYSQQNKKYR